MRLPHRNLKWQGISQFVGGESVNKVQRGRGSEVVMTQRVGSVITMPYIGAILSENYYKMKNRRTRPLVRMWMRELAEKVKQLHLEGEKFEIGVYGRFVDDRRPDVSNLFKVISDAVQDGLGVNDKNFRLVDKGYSVGCKDPELEITVTPLEELR